MLPGYPSTDSILDSLQVLASTAAPSQYRETEPELESVVRTRQISGASSHSTLILWDVCNTFDFSRLFLQLVDYVTVSQ